MNFIIFLRYVSKSSINTYFAYSMIMAQIQALPLGTIFYTQVCSGIFILGHDEETFRKLSFNCNRNLSIIKTFNKRCNRQVGFYIENVLYLQPSRYDEEFIFIMC